MIEWWGRVTRTRSDRRDQVSEIPTPSGTYAYVAHESVELVAAMTRVAIEEAENEESAA